MGGVVMLAGEARTFAKEGDDPFFPPRTSRFGLLLFALGVWARRVSGVTCFGLLAHERAGAREGLHGVLQLISILTLDAKKSIAEG